MGTILWRGEVPGDSKGLRHWQCPAVSGWGSGPLQRQKVGGIVGLDVEQGCGCGWRGGLL